MFGLFKKRPAQITEPHESNLVPRLKNLQFIATAGQFGADGLDAPVTAPFAGDLIVAYAFDMPHAFQFASRRECAELGLEGDQLRDLALQNLRARVKDCEVQGQDPVFTFQVGDGQESCLLLLEEFCEAFTGKVEGDLIAAVPTRDALLFTGSNSELGLQIASEAIEEFYSPSDNHALTKNLLRWKNRQWEVFQ